MEKTRNQLQTLAMDSVFCILTNISMSKETDVKSLVSDLCGEPYEECDVFIKEVVIETIKHFNEIVEDLNKHMTGWVLSRKDRVVQSILILAYVHFYYVETDVDKAIVINIAVNLAKKYGAGNDHKFVNSVLDKTLQR